MRMPGNHIAFDTVRKMALDLPGVEDGSAYGSPALKVGGKMFACMASNKSAEPGSLVVRIPIERRAELIAAEPGTYYMTDHYANYPSVLVRLSRIHPDALRGLLAMAYRFVTTRPKKSR